MKISKSLYRASNIIKKRKIIKRGGEIKISMSKSGRKIGRSVLARCVVVCIAAAFIGSSAIPVQALAALQTEDTVTVTVNAPAYVEETFTASIDVDNITDFNSGQFDLSFDSTIVNVTAVADGHVDGETIPVDRWEFMDKDRIRVILDVSGISGVSGSGYLAKISFEVVGKSGDRSVLDIQPTSSKDAVLVDTEAEEIPVELIDDEAIVGPRPVKVEVNAPEYVEETFNATIDVDSVTNLNSGQFDLSFDSSVVNVTDVADGSVDGESIPVDRWEFIDKDTIIVILEVSGISGVSGSGYLAKISFEVVGKSGDRSVLDIQPTSSKDAVLVDTEAEEIPVELIDTEVTVKASVFDTGEGTYPSIFGRHEGTIVLSNDIAVQKMYTYPCVGTGGHSEYIKIWNATGWNTEAAWSGYTGDWHNIIFSEPFTLKAGKTYNYIIKTGSYPQIIHEHEFSATGGTITCNKFVDANGRECNDWIPAIKLW